MITEYLQNSVQFQRLAEETEDAALKSQLMGQSDAYYELAVKHARELGMDVPERPKVSAAVPAGAAG